MAEDKNFELNDVNAQLWKLEFLSVKASVCFTCVRVLEFLYEV